MTIPPHYLIQTQSSIIATPEAFPAAWCVREVIFREHIDAPWQMLMLDVCELRNGHLFGKMQYNKAWREHVKADMAVMINITNIGDPVSCRRERDRRLSTMDPKPYGNSVHTITTHRRAMIVCSNGQIYANQMAAAVALGLNQGQISRHLRGELKHVKGITFKYL